MKAIRVQRPGGVDALRLEEIPDPQPGPGEALVRLEAAGVNFIDVYQRTGQYPMSLPFTPGSEAAGTVVAVGAGVSGVKAGDRVAGVNFKGSYAQLALAPAERLVILPASIDTRTAAAAMLQGLTAHYLVTDTFRLASGNVCLVHAAAGGVGLLLCQMAHRHGATVIGTVSTPEKAALAGMRVRITSSCIPGRTSSRRCAGSVAEAGCTWSTIRWESRHSTGASTRSAPGE